MTRPQTAILAALAAAIIVVVAVTIVIALAGRPDDHSPEAEAARVAEHTRTVVGTALNGMTAAELIDLCKEVEAFGPNASARLVVEQSADDEYDQDVIADLLVDACY